MKVTSLVPLVAGIALAGCGSEEEIIQSVIERWNPDHWDPKDEETIWTLPPLEIDDEQGCEVCALKKQPEQQCSWYTPESDSYPCAEGYIRIKREEACGDYNYGCAVDL